MLDWTKSTKMSFLLKETKALLSQYRLWAKKRLGQYFLIDEKMLGIIIKSAQLKKGETVLEIGPGTGLLTERLLAEGVQVIAIELDSGFYRLIQQKFALQISSQKLILIHGDILKMKLEDLPLSLPYKVVSNLPYQITTPLLEKIFTASKRPSLLVLLVQKEVAERAIACPPKMNRLALMVQFCGEVKIIKTVSKASFWPQPKVDSAILLIIPKKINFPISQKLLFQLIRQAFGQRRKQLKNIFEIKLLEKAKIEPKLRPENLSLSDWLRLAQVIEENSQEKEAKFV